MGIYWTLFGIGCILVVITRIILVAVDAEICYESVAYQIVTIPLMCACIALVGGTINGMWVSDFVDVNKSIWANIGIGFLVGILPAGLTYFLGFIILGLYKEDRTWVQAIFMATFIISIVLWTIPMANYANNIEYKEETGISNTQEYDLYYFCNIPVQQVSGNISGSSFLGNGNVSGKISTSEQLPYWYDDGSGKGLYNSVAADKSQIIFIEDGEIPFIRIITHYKKEFRIDNNVGEQTVNKEDTWTTYEFHLPKQVMQYNIG